MLLQGAVPSHHADIIGLVVLVRSYLDSKDDFVLVNI